MHFPILWPLGSAVCCVNAPNELLMPGTTLNLNESFLIYFQNEMHFLFNAPQRERAQE